MTASAIPALLGAYLIGSIDFAVVVARAKGVDIYAVGSGNPGTSNVMRTLGKGAAAMTLLGDLVKGLIGAAMGFVAAGEIGALAAGFFAVLGHCYPVFHRFQGGKGVATAAGLMFWVMPVATVVLAAVWGLLVAATRVASIGSLTVVVLTMPAAWWSGLRGSSLVVLAATILLVVYRHRGNIERLLGRGERKVVT
jgi:glycerol-3-phosphate acyltransferase PlsY